jgi:hypothetical protein
MATGREYPRIPASSHTYSTFTPQPSGYIGHFRRDLQSQEGLVSPQSARATMHYLAGGASGCAD